MGTQLAVADLPGLLPGAHKNHGLGLSFLRHVERCFVLVFVLDMGEEKPWVQLEQLRYELEQYRPGLADKPAAVIANKMDLEEAEEKLASLRDVVGMEIIPVSGKYGLNLVQLLKTIKNMKDANSEVIE